MIILEKGNLILIWLAWHAYKNAVGSDISVHNIYISAERLKQKNPMKKKELDKKEETAFESKENQGKEFNFSDEYKFTTIENWNMENLNIVDRHGKSCKHSSVAYRLFWENFGYFWINQTFWAQTRPYIKILGSVFCKHPHFDSSIKKNVCYRGSQG